MRLRPSPRQTDGPPGLDVTDTASLRAYLDEATGERGDTRADRTVEVFVALRRHAPADGWHRIEGMRAFVREIAPANPYVPPAVRRAAERPAAPGRPGFDAAWSRAGLPIQTRRLPVSDLLATIGTVPSVAEAFAERNLHDATYYYSKYLEWHLSLTAARAADARTVVDLGAAYQGFADVLRAAMPGCEAIMVDLAFAPGLERGSAGVHHYGTDAASLGALDDASVDLVVSHNAFEHFAGGSAGRAVREAERVLRPGGKMIVTPLFGAAQDTIVLQPFSAFVANDDAGFAQAILDEIGAAEAAGGEGSVRVRYNDAIISPYARAYDLAALRREVLDDTALVPCLVKVELDRDAEAPGARVALPKDLTRGSLDMRSLELTKAG